MFELSWFDSMPRKKEKEEEEGLKQRRQESLRLVRKLDSLLIRGTKLRP